ncbi:MAG: nucleotide exchange factor GrpE [Acidobacteria bacterium]|nr:nucleotide exchange factor GrpE [Acidobacteriota bacterium]
MGEEEKNGGGKDKELTPTDDITIEFVEHDEVHQVSETPDKIIEGKPQEEQEKNDAEDKLKSAEEKILRLRADFENYKRRTAKDWGEREKRAQMEILRQILPFLDNLERAFSNVPENTDINWLQGVEISIKDFQSLLKQIGLEEIDKCGVPFDPSFHESLGFDSNNDFEEGAVAKIVQKGYLFKERLLRPAKVLINKKSGSEKG